MEDNFQLPRGPGCAYACLPYHRLCNVCVTLLTLLPLAVVQEDNNFMQDLPDEDWRYVRRLIIDIVGAARGAQDWVAVSQAGDPGFLPANLPSFPSSCYCHYLPQVLATDMAVHNVEVQVGSGAWGAGPGVRARCSSGGEMGVPQTSLS